MEQPIKSHKIHASLSGLIRSARNQNFMLKTALLELIDNSIDAKASRVIITEQDGDLWITDNGNGFPNIPQALDYGKSDKFEGIGRYGVGLKDACAKYSNATIISSLGVEVRAPWEAIASGLHDGEVFPKDVKDDGKTYVILEDFRERYKSAICGDSIRRTYAPKLAANDVEISLNGLGLKPLERPSFNDEIDETFKFGGRLVRVYGGTFDPSDPMRRKWQGYNPFYQGRLIGGGCITDCGVGDEVCSFSFSLDLIDTEEESWQLATNKDDVDDLREVINQCYRDHTKPMLVKASEDVRKIELKNVEDIINDLLNSRGNQTRKKNQGSKGSVKPTETGEPKKRTYTATSGGDYKGGSSRSGESIRFRFSPLGGDTLGECRPHGKGVLVEANLDNEFIARNQTNIDVMRGIIKMVYSTYKEISASDLMPGEIIARIMDRAGTEMD